MLRNDHINCCKENELGLGVNLDNPEEMYFRPGMVMKIDGKKEDYLGYMLEVYAKGLGLELEEGKGSV